MDPHPYFDLLLHTDEELASLLGEQVTVRVTLHEWPLSCIQRLHLAGGQTFIYKSQCGPTVEAEFYAAARSAILPQARTLYRDPRYTCLLLEDLPGLPLQQMEMDEEAALTLGRSLLQQIAGIQGDPPVYQDISTWERWQEQMSQMQDTLAGLLANSAFTITRSGELLTLARSAQSPPVREAYSLAHDQRRIGLVHHDHSADNIILQEAPPGPETLKVIDWQRPLHAPADIDLAVLLASLGVDPRPYVHPGILTMTRLLLAHWCIDCAQTWFPPGCETYDKTVSEIAGSFL
jgi:hypothetical protein